jgi:hypothetical protein
MAKSPLPCVSRAVKQPTSSFSVPPCTALAWIVVALDSRMSRSLQNEGLQGTGLGLTTTCSGHTALRPAGGLLTRERVQMWTHWQLSQTHFCVLLDPVPGCAPPSWWLIDLHSSCLPHRLWDPHGTPVLNCTESCHRWLFLPLFWDACLYCSRLPGDSPWEQGCHRSGPGTELRPLLCTAITWLSVRGLENQGQTPTYSPSGALQGPC